MLQFQAWLVTASGRGQSSAAWLSCLCHRLGLGVEAGGACFGTKVRRHVCVYRQGHLSLDGTGSSKETNFRSGCGWTAQQRLSKGACLSCSALVRLCFQVINGAIPFLDITSPSHSAPFVSPPSEARGSQAGAGSTGERDRGEAPSRPGDGFPALRGRCERAARGK